MERIKFIVCISLISFLSLFLSYPSLLAIPSEGNFLPGLHTTIWGFQYNHIFKRDFNKVPGQGATTQYFLKASYGLTKRLFIDGKVGLGNVSFQRNDGLNLDFPTGFAGGYGIRYLFYADEKEKIKSIFGFQHISCHPFKDTVNNIEHRVIWDEWQGTWLFIKEFRENDIYFGPQYSNTQLKYKQGDLRRRLKSEDCWGFLLGADYQIKDDVNANAEIRFFDEWAINFGIGYKF
ncbi:MAG: hypothetical protein ABIG64_08185 [Candidatus Omnitrophota bacterium]